MKDAQSLPETGPKFICGRHGGPSLKKQLRSCNFSAFAKEVKERVAGAARLYAAVRDPRIKAAERVVLFHPQLLGFRLCMDLLRARAKPTWMFVLESSFFCLRSYNHVPGENGSCLRCLGGDWANIERYGCQSFPLPQENNREFLEFLRRQAALGSVRFMAQNQANVDLLRQHFGPDAYVKKVGLWVDFDDLERLPERDLDSPPDYDVVFHNSAVPAKGAAWALRLAAASPGVRFLFPFEKESCDELGVAQPPNADFRPMTWETGLRDQVRRATVTLCPSLWSATIEGALIKSLAFARRAGVVDIPDAYSGELNPELALKLPQKPEDAAAALQAYLDAPAPLSDQARAAWAKSFQDENKGLLARILATLEE